MLCKDANPVTFGCVVEDPTELGVLDVLLYFGSGGASHPFGCLLLITPALLALGCVNVGDPELRVAPGRLSPCIRDPANCVNMFSILKSCDFPFLTIITMRGEFEEFNSWQEPMGNATKEILRVMGFEIFRVGQSDQVTQVIKNALGKVFFNNSKVAVLLSQKFIGKKKW